jgi:hypothetical protein
MIEHHYQPTEPIYVCKRIIYTQYQHVGLTVQIQSRHLYSHSLQFPLRKLGGDGIGVTITEDVGGNGTPRRDHTSTSCSCKGRRHRITSGHDLTLRLNCSDRNPFVIALVAATFKYPSAEADTG